MKYLSGFVTGFLCGGGAVCAALLYLHCTGNTNLHMLDPRCVRELYQPKARWIRNHFDYSDYGRHYRPFHDITEPKPAWQINPDCSGCVYEGMSSDFDPCRKCKRAFEGCSTDYFTEENACDWCKHKTEANSWPCTQCLRLNKDALDDWYEYKEDDPEPEAEED